MTYLHSYPGQQFSSVDNLHRSPAAAKDRSRSCLVCHLYCHHWFCDAEGTNFAQKIYHDLFSNAIVKGLTYSAIIMIGEQVEHLLSCLILLYTLLHQVRTCISLLSKLSGYEHWRWEMAVMSIIFRHWSPWLHWSLKLPALALGRSPPWSGSPAYKVRPWSVLSNFSP